MINLIRTNSSSTNFQDLVKELDEDLKIRDGDEHVFFAKLNKTDTIKHVVLAYTEGVAVGCGAIRKYTDDIMEVKRMFVMPEKRGEGIASLVLKELETWCKELGFKKCILETGEKQPEAIHLYTKNNYQVIPNYGQYADVASSVCFEKVL